MQTQSPLGYDIQPEVNKEVLERHLRLTRPLTVAVLQDAGYAKHLKRNVIPDSVVYLRTYDADGDENDIWQYTPDQYFDKYLPLTEGIIGLQLGNEPGFSTSILARTNLFFREAVERNALICGPSFSVGTTPQIWEGWDTQAGSQFAELLSQHPDKLACSANEYFCIAPTSGMVTAQTPEGGTLFFVDAYLKPEFYPPFDKVLQFNHVGRIKSLFDFWAKRGLPPGIVDLGEFGVDAVSDGALDAYYKAQPFAAEWFPHHLRGYKTYVHYWAEKLGLTYQQAYRIALVYLWRSILKPIGLRSARLFCAGNSGAKGTVKDWKDFDVATDVVMLEELELALPLLTGFAAVPFPADFDSRAVCAVADHNQAVFIRAEPSLQAAKVGSLRRGDTFAYIPPQALAPAERVEMQLDGKLAYWLPIDNGGVRGWSWDGVIARKDTSARARLETALEKAQASVQAIDAFSTALLVLRQQVVDTAAEIQAALQSIGS